MTAAGWVILETPDHGRPRRYVPRVWDTEREAQHELQVLLRHYPPDSEWRRRLSVAPLSAGEVERGKIIRDAMIAKNRANRAGST